MLNSLTLNNFKAYSSLQIELKPITILLGPNNSGKSSILSANRMLTQTILSYDPNVPLLLNGVLGDFGTYKDIVFENNKKRHIEIGVSVESPRSPRWKGAPFDQSAPTIMQMKYKYRTALRELIMTGLKVSKGTTEIAQFTYSEDNERHTPISVLGKGVPQSVRAELSRRTSMFHFLPRNIFLPERKADTRLGDFLDPEIRAALNSLAGFCAPVHAKFFHMEYVGAMRAPPSRAYLYSGERHLKVGSSGENAPNILAMDTARRGAKSRKLLQKIVEWLAKAKIASDVKINPLSDRNYEIRFQNAQSGEYQNFADVGFGNSQVLPVLVAGYNLSEGELFLVEEPEIHLHPRAQSELGDFFLDLFKSNVQSIIETHSEYLILRIQQHIAKGLLKPQDVCFYYISSKDKGKDVCRIDIDQNGRFTTPWPEGFFPQRLSEADELVRIRSNRELKSNQ